MIWMGQGTVVMLNSTVIHFFFKKVLNLHLVSSL